jgi:hypothetical protein
MSSFWSLVSECTGNWSHLYHNCLLVFLQDDQTLQPGNKYIKYTTHEKLKWKKVFMHSKRGSIALSLFQNQIDPAGFWKDQTLT